LSLGDNKLKDKRVIVITGDGAFQQSAQSVASYAELNQNTVVFIFDNGVYGIEQRLVNPNPFRSDKSEHSSKDFYNYNKLFSWKYDKLVDVFGKNGEGIVVDTVEKLQNAITKIKKNSDKYYVVQVKIPSDSYPSVIKASISDISEPGEDEWRDPKYPPSIF